MGRVYGTTATPTAPTGTGRIYGAQPTTTKSKSLKDIEGLKVTLQESGLGHKAGRLPSQGEDPEKFWSGGFITDVFDTLNALQYGVTGLIKGKGFAEGIKTRQSFSDKDALGDFGLPGVIAGIAADIAVDPLTYIAPWTAFRKIPGAVKATTATKNAFVKTAVGKKLGSMFVWINGADPVFKKMANNNIVGKMKGASNIKKLARPFRNMTAENQQIIAAARKASKLGVKADSNIGDLLSKFPQKTLDDLQELYVTADRLSEQAIKHLDLPKPLANAYRENIGQYIRSAYRFHEAGQALPFAAKATRIPTQLYKGKKWTVKFKGRDGAEKFKTFASKQSAQKFYDNLKSPTEIFKGLPDEIKESLDEILEAGYPTIKSMLQLNNAVENAKFFKYTAAKFAKNVKGDGYEQLAKSLSLGKLSGKWVPEPIAAHINEILRVKTPFEKSTGKVVATFKFAKVILNPATHARNIMSNQLLNWFEGLPPGHPVYIKALKELKTKGKWYKEAKEFGLGLDTFTASELRGFLDGPEISKLGSKTKGALEKIANLYQKEEEWAKMAQYIYQRTTKGLKPEKAWEVAERATFNYAQVTPFIRRMRESIFGYPFITFAYKATPQVIKTAAMHPTRISNIGKIKNAIEGVSDSEELRRERATEPDWVRDGFYVKLPMKDKFGRSTYLDLTYIMPFGDILTGQFIQRDVSRETGLSEGLPQAAIKKLAFPNMARELIANQDFFGNKIFKDGDSTQKQLSDVMLYLTRSMAPPLVGDQLPGGYKKDGTRRAPVRTRVAKVEELGPEQGGKQTRTLTQELLRTVGIKMNPIDIEMQEGYAEWYQEKAIRTILEEEGIIGELNIPFKKD